jgi:phosphate transport system permease protein
VTTLPTDRPPLPAAPAVELRSTLSRRWRLHDNGATVLLWGAAVVAALPLLWILLVLLQKAAGTLSWHFLTGDLPRITNLAPEVAARLHLDTRPAVGPAIVGTLIITGAAAAMAVPIGVLGAVYLNEYGRRSVLARLLRFLADVMVGVPSIVAGLFVYTLVVLRTGLSGWAGAFALAFLMLPIVVRTTEEMLRLVPDDLRQSSLALGAPRWRTITGVVVPAAAPGIVSGAILAIARAAGETAPVLFTIGIVTSTNASLAGSNTTLSMQIFANAKQVNPLANEVAWGAALTLVLLVFLLTLLSRLVAFRFVRAHDR